MMSSTRGRGRIGVLVPFTNTNLEPDMQMMRPEGVSLHFARLGGYDEDEIPDETQMANLGASDLDETLRLISGVKPDVVMYGCTSATLAHGPSFDRDLSQKIRIQSGAETVTAAGALVYALRKLSVNKVGFASPYVPSLNDASVSFLENEGIETLCRGEFQVALDNDGQGALTPDDVLSLAHSADHPDAEAIVLSCTDMRSVECIEQLEAELNKPVVTSNQAMVFQALDCVDLGRPPKAFGRLFERTIQ